MANDILLDVPDLKVVIEKPDHYHVILQNEAYKTILQNPEQYLVQLSRGGVSVIGLPLSAVFAISASYALSSSYAVGGNGIFSGSFYGNGTYITNVQTSSYATTASYALNALPTFPYTGSAQITGSLGITGSFEVGTVQSSSILVVSSSGRVGINLNTPLYALHVSGAIFATDDVTAFSDRRMKTDITPIHNALDMVRRLQGVTFKRIDKVNSKIHMGFIAQDVKEIIPEVVVGTEWDGYGVSYGNITAVLVEAIKELNEKVDRLQ